MTMIEESKPEINKLVEDIKNNSLNNKNITYLQEASEINNLEKKYDSNHLASSSVKPFKNNL